MFAARSKSVEIFSNATLNLQFSKKKYFTAVTLEHFYTKLKNLFISYECTYSSVTRMGDLLHFGQLFKAFGNNYFAQITHILGNFCKVVNKIFKFSSEIIFGQLL